MKESLKARIKALRNEVFSVGAILDDNDRDEVGELTEDDVDILFNLAENAYELSVHAYTLYEGI